jgi:hypothetical protein
MVRSGLLLSAVLVVAGCDGGSKHEAVQAAERLAGAMCKCERNSCFEDVMEKHKADVATVEKYLDETLAEGDRKALQAAVERAEQCARKSSGR